MPPRGAVMQKCSVSSTVSALALLTAMPPSGIKAPTEYASPSLYLPHNDADRNPAFSLSHTHTHTHTHTPTHTHCLIITDQTHTHTHTHCFIITGQTHTHTTILYLDPRIKTNIQKGFRS